MAGQVTVHHVESQSRFDGYIDLVVVLRTEAGEWVRQKYDRLTPGEALDTLEAYDFIAPPF